MHGGLARGGIAERGVEACDEKLESGARAAARSSQVGEPTFRELGATLERSVLDQAAELRPLDDVEIAEQLSRLLLGGEPHALAEHERLQGGSIDAVRLDAELCEVAIQERSTRAGVPQELAKACVPAGLDHLLEGHVDEPNGAQEAAVGSMLHAPREHRARVRQLLEPLMHLARRRAQRFDGSLHACGAYPQNAERSAGRHGPRVSCWAASR
jgi:hypothetical protein